MPRRNLIFFIFMGACLWALYFFMIGAPNKARSYLAEHLSDAGFTNVAIGNLDVSLGGIKAQNISLDEKGLDGISQVEIDLNWPLFLMFDHIHGLHIHGLQLTRDIKDAPNLPAAVGKKLLLQSNYKLKLTNALIDLISPVGNIRIVADISSDKFKNDSRKMNARLYSNQFQVGFDSKWQGSITNKGQLDLFGEIFEGRINTKHIKVSRISGWSSLSTTEDGILSQVSLVAGRGMFKNLPLQSMSLKAQKLNNESSVSIRSGVSGIPDTLFTADVVHQSGENHSSISLNGSNLGKIMQSIKGEKDLPKALKDLGPFSVIANFQPDLKFANGPSPYALAIEIEGKNEMTGNLLFYPDTMDIRGSIDVGDELMPDIKKYFDVPDENAHGGFIRLDQPVQE